MTERSEAEIGSDAIEARSRGIMARREFFDEIVSRMRPLLPEARRDFRIRANLFLLKVDYGNPRVHYEVWCDTERGILGIGLHFEDGPASTLAYLAYFDRLIVEIKHRLGPEVELERWTASWAHIYEHRTLEPLSRQLAGRTANRLATMIEVLQPLVEAAGVSAERSAGGSEAERTGPWRKWRR